MGLLPDNFRHLMREAGFRPGHARPLPEGAHGPPAPALWSWRPAAQGSADARAGAAAPCRRQCFRRARQPRSLTIRMRIDRLLFNLRFAKSRTLAQRWIAEGLSAATASACCGRTSTSRRRRAHAAAAQQGAGASSCSRCPRGAVRRARRALLSPA
jgi:hypothetical protein